MDNVRDILLFLWAALPEIGILLFLWGTIDNYFLIRYGGRVNRGFTVWSRPIREDEQQFLENLREDILDAKTRRFGLYTRIKKDFIMVSSKEVLIRFNKMGQRTSWPLVGYVNLSLPKPVLEHRLSLPMLIGTVLIVTIHLIIAAVLTTAFVFSWLFEAGGLNNYLSQKVNLYFTIKTH